MPRDAALEAGRHLPPGRVERDLERHDEVAVIHKALLRVAAQVHVAGPVLEIAVPGVQRLENPLVDQAVVVRVLRGESEVSVVEGGVAQGLVEAQRVSSTIRKRACPCYPAGRPLGSSWSTGWSM